MAAPLTGQVAVTGTAAQLTPAKVVSVYAIKAPLTNVKPVFIGSAGVTLTTGYQLDPGDVFEYEVRNQTGLPVLAIQISDLYAVGTAPDAVTWLASP